MRGVQWNVMSPPALLTWRHKGPASGNTGAVLLMMYISSRICRDELDREGAMERNRALASGMVDIDEGTLWVPSSAVLPKMVGTWA